MRLVRWFLVLGCLMVSIQVQAEEIQLELNGKVYKIMRSTAKKKLYDSFDGASTLMVFQTKEQITMPDGTVYERDATSKGITLGVMEVRGDVYFYSAKTIFQFRAGTCHDVFVSNSEDFKITPLKLENNVRHSAQSPPFCLIYFDSRIFALAVYRSDRTWCDVNFPQGAMPEKPTKLSYRSIGKDCFIIACQSTRSPNKFVFFLNAGDGEMRSLTLVEEILYNPSPTLVYVLLGCVGFLLMFFLRRRKKPVVAVETS